MNNDPKIDYEQHYKLCNVPEMKNYYIQLLSNNINYLLNKLYDDIDDVEQRCSIALHIIITCGKLIPADISNKILRDLEDLKKDREYLNKFSDPSEKKKYLKKEIDMLYKYIELDDTLTLNTMDENYTINTTSQSDDNNCTIS